MPARSWVPVRASRSAMSWWAPVGPVLCVPLVIIPWLAHWWWGLSPAASVFPGTWGARCSMVSSWPLPWQGCFPASVPVGCMRAGGTSLPSGSFSSGWFSPGCAVSAFSPAGVVGALSWWYFHPVSAGEFGVLWFLSAFCRGWLGPGAICVVLLAGPWPCLLSGVGAFLFGWASWSWWCPFSWSAVAFCALAFGPFWWYRWGSVAPRLGVHVGFSFSWLLVVGVFVIWCCLRERLPLDGYLPDWGRFSLLTFCCGGWAFRVFRCICWPLFVQEFATITPVAFSFGVVPASFGYFGDSGGICELCSRLLFQVMVLCLIGNAFHDLQDFGGIFWRTWDGELPGVFTCLIWVMRQVKDACHLTQSVRLKKRTRKNPPEGENANS